MGLVMMRVAIITVHFNYLCKIAVPCWEPLFLGFYIKTFT